MLLSLLPLANVLPTIWPTHGAFAISLILNELTFIFATVCPGEQTKSVHLVLLPLSFKMFTIRPIVFSIPTDFVFLEFAFVVTALGEY
jgi:hypothetical protein